MNSRRILVFLACGGLACASTTSQPPIDAGVLEPGPRERVVVDQLVLLVDASASMPARSLFQTEKNLLASFARSMPEGDYEVAAISFGGFAREREPLAPFDRARLERAAQQLDHLAEGTPLHRALREAGELLEGRSGRAAVVVYSDGLASDEIGRPVDEGRVLAAAAALREGYDGTLCIHTVQVGSAPQGTALLSRLAQSSGCGSFRTAATVASSASLHGFQREVLLGARPTLPAVAAAPSDRDGDGVYDGDDLCPTTPYAATVDARGCWVVPGVLFEPGSAQIRASFDAELDGVAHVLRENPDLRVRIDGHTDSRGSTTNNEALSERRARAVRDRLVAAGISAERIEAKGWGESRPVSQNATSEGRRANRRTEIFVLR